MRFYKIRVLLKQYFIPIISFLIIFFIIIFSYFQVKNKTSQQRSELFASRVFLVKSSVNTRLLDYIQILKGGKAFIESSDTITRIEWKKFISSLDVDLNYPGIQGIGYSIFIKPEDLQKHINHIRASGFPDYKIIPEGSRSIYTTIIYIEPFDNRNLRAFGYDMFSEPVRKRAMESSMDTGEPTLSGKVTLVQETGSDVQPGFLIYVPVYSTDDSASSQLNSEQRRIRIKGFVYSPFRANDMFGSLLPEKFQDLNIEIYDGEEMTEDAILYSSLKEGENYSTIKDAEFKKFEYVNIAGHNWIIAIYSKPNFGARDSGNPILILAGGSVISLLIFFILIIRSEIRRTNLLKQTITDTVTDAIFVVDNNGYVTFINPSVTTITGFKLEDFKNKTFNEVMRHNTDAEVKGSEMNEFHNIKDNEDLLRKKDGTFFPAISSISPIIENNIEIGKLIEVKDITKEKMAQEMNAKNLETKNFLLEAMPDKIWTANEKGEFNFFNHNWTQYSGHSVEELLKNGLDFITFSEDKVQNNKNIQQRLLEVRPFQIEHRFKRNDGEFRWHLTRGVPQTNEEGNIEMWVGTSTDIHEQKLQVEELKRINADLDNFIYTASHDLKAPISNMEGLVEALRVPDESIQEKFELIELMDKSLVRLGRTINDLTEIAKIQKQKESPEEKIPFSEIVNEILQDLQRQIEESKAKIYLSFEVRSVRFSKKNLRSIFYNLISNSIKYRKPNVPPVLQIKTYREKDKLIILASDNGLGIKQENKGRVFEMFRRLHAHVEGTGMGLYIVKRIVENARGTIDLESIEGKGTTFKIVLPGENLFIKE